MHHDSRPRRRASRLLTTAVLTIGSVVAVAAPAAPSAAADDGFRPLPAPRRLVDTRAGEPTVDGRFSGIGKRQAGTTLRVDVADRAGLGGTPGTVALNLTVTEPEVAGFLTVWPCDAERPTASNLNYVAGQTVAVAALSRVAPDGTVCVYHLTTTHLVVDVAGSFPAGTFAPLDAPERLADTREGERTIDGEAAGDGALRAGSTYRVDVAGRGTVPADATAVAITVTATDVTAAGFVTVYPCDAGRPTASNVNYEPGFTTPNLVITRLDPRGDVCIYTLVEIDLVVDVAGTLPSELFTPLPEPRRLLDTRDGAATFDDSFRGTGLQMTHSTLQLPVAGRNGLPDDVTAVVLNVTSTEALQPGFVTAHPQGTPRPASSNLNIAPERISVANLVVAGVGPSGDVCLYNQGVTHLVVDVAGYLTGPAPAAGADSCPLRPALEPTRAVRDALLYRPDLVRTVGVDRVAVYVCDVPPGSTVFSSTERHDVTPAEIAAFANAEVAPYFDRVSNGRYAVEFVANGTVAVGVNDGPGDCIDAAIDATGDAFTNALVADSTLGCCGFAGPGTVFTGPGAPDDDVFDRPVRRARRGAWVGGGNVSAYPDPATIAHEIGHTLHWPHSYTGDLDGFAREYDNPIDLMSGGQGPCEANGIRYWCVPGSTLAFNRFASDWLGDGQVNAHLGGTANYLFDEPAGGGLQMVLAPDPANPLSALTFEARVRSGDDEFVATEGVAVHVVDQYNRSGGLSGVSTGRRQRQAVGAADSYEHVVRVGQTRTIHGVTITVFRRHANAFEVRLIGDYRMPDGTFFTETADEAPAAVSCATLPLETALDAGCIR